MSITYVCDYCGRPIEDDDLYMTLSVSGYVPREAGLGGKEFVNGWIGHYHAQPWTFGESSCYRRIRDSINLTEEYGPTLETIETKSGQWVAKQRRKLRHEGEDD